MIWWASSHTITARQILCRKGEFNVCVCVGGGGGGGRDGMQWTYVKLHNSNLHNFRPIPNSSFICWLAMKYRL